MSWLLLINRFKLANKLGKYGLEGSVVVKFISQWKLLNWPLGKFEKISVKKLWNIVEGMIRFKLISHILHKKVVNRRKCYFRNLFFLRFNELIQEQNLYELVDAWSWIFQSWIDLQAHQVPITSWSHDNDNNKQEVIKFMVWIICRWHKENFINWWIEKLFWCKVNKPEDKKCFYFKLITLCSALITQI